MSAAFLQIQVSTLASIISKWKTFGITRTLPRVCQQAKLSDWGVGAFVKVTIRFLVTSLTEDRAAISAALHQSACLPECQSNQTLLIS